MHVERWPWKWLKWAIGQLRQQARAPDMSGKVRPTCQIQWYRDLSGKRGTEFSVWKNLGPASTWLYRILYCIFQSSYRSQVTCSNEEITDKKNYSTINKWTIYIFNNLCIKHLICTNYNIHHSPKYRAKLLRGPKARVSPEQPSLSPDRF